MNAQTQIERIAERAAVRAAERVAARLEAALPGVEAVAEAGDVTVSAHGLRRRWALEMRWLGGLLR